MSRLKNFYLLEHVRIKETGIVGQIIDIYNDLTGAKHYTIEDDTERGPDNPWPQYDCLEGQIEKLPDHSEKQEG